MFVPQLSAPAAATTCCSNDLHRLSLSSVRSHTFRCHAIWGTRARAASSTSQKKFPRRRGLLLRCEPRLLWSHDDAVRGRRGCHHWRHLLQLVVRRRDGLHLLLVHQFVAFLHLLAFFSSSVLEPDLDLQEEINLSAQFSRGTHR